ncbi:MAG: ribonuclease J, partial [Campylobacter sp.]|nr:ribonuclease J [Campylobacter sp.]
MNEENTQTLGEKPSKKRRYRNHKDNLKKEANQAKTNLKAGESTQTAQDVEAKEQKKSKKRRKNNNPTIKIGGNEDWQKDMKAAIEANKASHELRLEPLKYLNSAEHKITITPLGGLGEIGGNMTIFETNNDAIIIDIGMSFPTEGMHGVDILVPDFDYVRKIKNKIRGIIITH